MLICNSYTLDCQSVRGDNPQTLYKYCIPVTSVYRPTLHATRQLVLKNAQLRWMNSIKTAWHQLNAARNDIPNFTAYRTNIPKLASCACVRVCVCVTIVQAIPLGRFVYLQQHSDSTIYLQGICDRHNFSDV